MKTNNFFSKAAIGILIVLCLAMTASQANAEPKIDSVSDTLGVMGQNLPITIRGSGFDATTRVSMSLDVGNMAFIKGTINSANRVEVSGNIAYVSTNSGVSIADISNPAAPSIINTMNNVSIDITIVGNKAYSTQNGVFKVMDISNPKVPILIGSLNGVNGSIISISQKNAYLKNGRDIEVIDLNTLSVLGTVNNLTEIVTPQPCSAFGYTDAGVVTVIDDVAYVVSFCIRSMFGDSLYQDSLSLVNISNPSTPKMLGSVELEGEIMDPFGKINEIKVSGNKAYIACGR